MSNVASRAPPAGEAVMSVFRDRLTAATRVGPDEGDSQAQAHRNAGQEGLEPGARPFSLTIILFLAIYCHLFILFHINYAF